MNNQELVPQDNPVTINANLLGEKPTYLFHEHYGCSDHDHEPNDSQRENSELWEADTYRYEFQLAIFIKSWIISLIDISGLGLFVMAYGCISGSKFVENYYDTGLMNNLINLFGMINTVFLIYSLWTRNFVYQDANSLSYLVGLFFFSIISASVNSFLIL